MKTRRKYNWPELIKSFEESGLSQTEFCRQNDLNPKYFSLKRSKLLNASQKPSGFSKVDIAKPPSSTNNIMVKVGRCQIVCPEGMPIDSFSALIHQLA